MPAPPHGVVFEVFDFFASGKPRIFLGPFRYLAPLLALLALCWAGVVSHAAAVGALAFTIFAANGLHRVLLPVGQPPYARLGRGNDPPVAGPADPGMAAVEREIAARNDGRLEPGATPAPPPPCVTDTVVIGAGAAGLAAGACLVRRGVPAVVLESATACGLQWRYRYDRLHLHTEKEASGLPYVPFPDYLPMYPSKDDVADYLAAYQRQMRVPVLFGQRVARVRASDGGGGASRWEVTTEAGRVFRARNVVVAVGDSAVPRAPVFKGEAEHFAGRVLHSSAFKTGREFRGLRVLVVGFGNSGAEMAMDLVENGAAAVDCVVRSPQLVLDRDTLGGGWLNAATVGQLLGVNFLPWPVADLIFKLFPVNTKPHIDMSAKTFSQMTNAGRAPLLDIGMIALVRGGQIGVRPSIDRFERGGSAVLFADGSRGEYDVLLKATGYDAGLERLFERPGDFLVDGRPRDFGREAVPGSGVYFNGFKDHVGKLRQMSIEALRVARKVAAEYRALL